MKTMRASLWRCHYLVRFMLVGVAALISAGCTSPCMGRKAELNRGYTSKVYAGAVNDLVELGQFDVNGNAFDAKVSKGVYSRQKGSFDYDVLAANLLPQAYMDLAHVAMVSAQHAEAIRHAQRALDLSGENLAEDRWLLQRLVNLRDANLLLYRAYLDTGELSQAAVCYRQHLIISKLLATKAGKDLQSQLLCIRMSSMRLRSEHQTKQHWSNLAQILQAMAAAGNAAAASDAQSRGDYRAAASHRASMAVNLAAVAAIEQYKHTLQSLLRADLSALMRDADTAGTRMRRPPNRDDLLRAKRASDLYRELRIRGTVNPADQVDLRELDVVMADAARANLLTQQGDGTVVLRSGAARFITAAARLDQVPLSIPPIDPSQEDEWLDQHLSPGLYRLAGMSFSAEDKALLKQLAAKEGEVRIHPSTESGRQMILAVRKLERKIEAYQAWRQERGGA